MFLQLALEPLLLAEPLLHQGEFRTTDHVEQAHVNHFCSSGNPNSPISPPIPFAGKASTVGGSMAISAIAALAAIFLA